MISKGAPRAHLSYLEIPTAEVLELPTAEVLELPTAEVLELLTAEPSSLSLRFRTLISLSKSLETASERAHSLSLCAQTQ